MDDDAFERQHRQNVRKSMEESAAGLRLRREPRSDIPEEHQAEFRAWRAQEDQRISDERAGRETQKTFAEMNPIELAFAMASYSPAQYPAALEAVITERVAAVPAQKLDAEGTDALLEVLSLQEQLRGDHPAMWMMDRLQELTSHPSATVSVKAFAVYFEIQDEIARERERRG